MLDITKRVYSIIVKVLEVENSEVVPEASFIDDLGADSLDLAVLATGFEEEFKIEISEEDAEKLHNVGEVVQYIEANVA